MKHIDNYKIYEKMENIEDFYSKLPVDKIELDDIFIDLVDVGYKLKHRIHYLTEDGVIRQSNVNLIEYYPILEILITRENISKDFRKWNNDNYYEDADDVLDAIYFSISRLKSTVKEHSDKIKVYYSLRNINQI